MGGVDRGCGVVGVGEERGKRGGKGFEGGGGGDYSGSSG